MGCRTDGLSQTHTGVFHACEASARPPPNLRCPRSPADYAEVEDGAYERTPSPALPACAVRTPHHHYECASPVLPCLLPCSSSTPPPPQSPLNMSPVLPRLLPCSPLLMRIPCSPLPPPLLPACPGGRGRCVRVRPLPSPASVLTPPHTLCRRSRTMHTSAPLPCFRANFHTSPTLCRRLRTVHTSATSSRSLRGWALRAGSGLARYFCKVNTFTTLLRAGSGLARCCLRVWPHRHQQ